MTKGETSTELLKIDSNWLTKGPTDCSNFETLLSSWSATHKTSIKLIWRQFCCIIFDHNACKTLRLEVMPVQPNILQFVLIPNENIQFDWEE